MGPSQLSLNRFVRAVHRRYVVLRVIEHAGIGLLGGCVVASVFAGVLIWRGEDARPVTWAALGSGTLAGAAWGIARRPTSLASAAEADRQLRTADLFSTAWLIGDARDAFEHAVLVQANERCRNVSPGSVTLYQLGVRAWGGIGLAVAFVGVLGALSANAPEAGAVASRDVGGDANRSVRSPHADRPIVEVASSPSRLPRRVERNPADERAFNDDTDPTNPADDAVRDAAPNDEPKDARRGSSPGTGTSDGQGRRNVPPVKSRLSSSPAFVPQTRSSSHPEGAATGGAGRAADDPASDETSAGGSRTDGRALTPAPRWTNPGWPAAAEAARRAVRSGAVGDDYRDLVREYFGGDPISGR